MDAVDLIAEAIVRFEHRPPETWRASPGYSDAERLLIGALECFHGNGAAEEEAGDTDTTGHIFRVDRFTLLTDSSGFAYPTEHETLEAAEAAVNTIAAAHVTDGHDA